MDTSNAESLIVHAQSFTSEFRKRDQLSFYMRKTILIDKDAKVFRDTNSGFWWIGLATITGKPIKIRRDDQIIEMSGKGAIYVPPYSVIEWHLAEDVELQTIFGLKPPTTALQEPHVLFGDDLEIENLAAEPEVFKRGTPVGRVSPSAYPKAHQIRQAIIENYRSTPLLSTIAEKLGMKDDAFAKTFRQAFGFTATTYRKQLNSFDAFLALIAGKNVTEAAMDANFNDLSHFNRVFQGHMGAKPSDYKSTQ